MTDFELVTAFNDMATNTQSIFMNYVAILFAYLVAAYLTAHKLSKVMTIAVTALFTIVTFQETFTLLFTWKDQVGLMRAFQARATLNWHGASSGGIWVGTLFYLLFGVTTMGGYVGALVFFFLRRRSDLRAR